MAANKPGLFNIITTQSRPMGDGRWAIGDRQMVHKRGAKSVVWRDWIATSLFIAVCSLMPETGNAKMFERFKMEGLIQIYAGSGEGRLGITSE